MVYKLKIQIYDNEDQILQDLLETNIRQRGDVGGSAKKMGLRIRELERLYGVRDGSNGGTGKNQYTKELEPNKSVEATPQEKLAMQMGLSVDTIQNYKTLANMIPELSDLVDTGIVTKTTALAMMRNLSSDEQEELKQWAYLKKVSPQSFIVKQNPVIRIVHRAENSAVHHNPKYSNLDYECFVKSSIL